MFRNQYDHDVTVWSPQGRLFQLEYAMEAVKQGSATIGVKSKKYAVLVALKRAQNDLCDHQTKILAISKHCGLSMSGLTADGRSLTNFMRHECLNEEFVYNRNMELARLLAIVGDKMQTPTQIYGRRPYGVGLLIAGYDETGAHIYETCPSANYFDCRAMAIGARSQSARTFIEKNLDSFSSTSELGVDELVKLGLEGLRETLPSEQELNEKNVSIAVVGEDRDFTVYNDEDIKPWLSMLDSLKKKSRSTAAAEQPAAQESSSSTQAQAATDEQPPATGTTEQEMQE